MINTYKDGLVSSMKVVALIGKSGTGKSYQSLILAKNKKIDFIIDDGLFICGNKILSGKSAKRQSTKVGAVKTALFTDEEHRKQVLDTISKYNPSSILIIGTSDKMTDRIAERLQLPPIEEKIRIEEITDEKERESARKQRHELGKHVIPVPTFQLKHEFSGYFLDPLKIFRKISSGKHEITEKSVVRPTYSYLGEYIISDRVITDIVTCNAYHIKGMAETTKVSTISSEKGIVIDIDITVQLGVNIINISQKLQKKVKEEVEIMTALNVISVHIHVRNIFKIEK
jgi:uncharacterized alkaline shock family protein YloU